MRIRPPLPIAGMIAVLLAACQAAPPPAPAPLTFPAARRDAAMDAAAAALRARGLRVERFDRLAGVVAAFPEGIPTSAEWWKGNSANGGPWQARANWQDLRHRVRIEVSPTTGGTCALAVIAVVERLDSPARRVVVSAENPAMGFGSNRNGGTPAAGNPAVSLSEVPAHLSQRGAEDGVWQNIGRDGAIETRLARDIARRLD